ncbi:MAG: YfhO family protein [Agathobacter sp.]|nr:YfhO family protein [Agathobacter sp.]
MKNWKVILEKNWIWYILAFMIPFVVSICICIGAGVYPFGENCILHMDMYHQYCPFFMELQEKLTSGGSLLYSWNLGLGSDFVALYAYYLASPLNWLLVLCPKGLVIEFMTVTTWVKIAAAGLFFFLYLKEHFQLIGKDKKYHLITVMPALVFSTAYAFSGFVATYSWNIMWMDVVALAPLIILGLERLVKQNKPMLYYVSLSIAILSNFYIALIVCIFLCLYFVILFLEQKKGKIKAIVNFTWFSLLAGGTGAVLLIPTAIVLGYSGSGSEFPESMEWYFGITEELSRLCVLAERYEGNDHWPSLYCGVFTVFLVVMYVFNKRIKWQQKIPRVLLLVFFIAGFANNYLDYIWHGLRFPTSLPGRQSFLFAFVMLVVGYETYRKRKGNTIWHAIAATAICVVVLVLGMENTDEAIVDTTSFVLTEVFLIAYMLCFAINKMAGKKIRPVIRGLAFGLAMGEIVFNMAVTGFYSLSRTSYLAKMEDYEALIDMAEEDAQSDSVNGEKIFYRIEDTERKTKNDDSLYGYPSATIFSTLMNMDVSRFYQRVYMEGGKNYYCYNGATPIVSSMLHVKYMLSDNAGGENALRRLVGQSGNYFLYENKYCLPLGFMMSEEAVENWDNNQGNKINQINSLATALGAENYMMVRISNPTMEVAEGKTTFNIKADGFYYVRHQGCDASTLSFRINDGPTTRWNKATHSYLFEIGECKAGDVVTISNTASDSVYFYLYRMNLDAVEQAYETLSQQTMVTEEYTDTSIKGYIDVEEAGRLIFSIPDESGWSLYVDGKETEIEYFKETFISVHLEEGHHTIELRYMSPKLLVGAVISVTCVALFVVTMFLRKKLSERKEQKVLIGENNEQKVN